MIDLATAKQHLRIDSDLNGEHEDDAYITTLIDAAYNLAENYTGRTIKSAEIVEKLDDFSNEIELKHTPVQSIASITYYDTNDTQQTQTEYFLDTRRIKAVLMPKKDQSWPTTNKDYENVVITYQAGYAVIPESIDQAVLMLIGSMYWQRETHIIGVSVSDVPLSAQYLLGAYRVISV